MNDTHCGVPNVAAFTGVPSALTRRSVVTLIARAVRWIEKSLRNVSAS
jgi:hypothetical protein